MERVKSPCKNCEKRKLLCHDSCTSYKEYKRKIEAIKEGRASFIAERMVAVESSERNKKYKNH